MHRLDRRASTQPKWRARNPHHDWSDEQRRTSCDLKGTLARTPRSRTCDRPLVQPFHTSTDASKSSTEKWRGVITHHAVSAKAAQFQLALSSCRAVSPNVAIHGAEVGAKAVQKRHKQRHQEAATDDDDGTNERVGGSGAERAAEAMGSSKCQA
jgi:hypothetical protein